MNVTTVIINYQTPKLLHTAVSSFKEQYPDIDLVIVDNGSKDHSTEVIQKLKRDHPEGITTRFLENNIFHGPAMDLAARELVNTGFIFFLDSDTKTLKKGFLEQMVELLKPENHYAVGQMIRVDKRGFKNRDGMPVLTTPWMMIKREIYLKFPPFIHHGQPTLKNFEVAQKEGYKLIDFPVDNFIYHEWRGTASKYGYKLGWKGKWNYLMNKLGF